MEWRVLLCLLLVFACLPALAGAEPSVSIQSTTPRGPGVVDADTGSNETFLWRGERLELDVTISATGDGGAYEVCAYRGGESTPNATASSGATSNASEVPCRDVSISGTETITVSDDSLTEEVGSRDVVVSVEAANGTEDAIRDSRNVSIRVVSKSGDVDDDGLSNLRETKVGTNITTADTDGDAVSDGKEVDTYGSDPLSTDTDSDGLDDGAELHTHGTNLNEADTDGDGLEDGAEDGEYQTNPMKTDTDSDGLDDGVEVREADTNPNKADTDGDGLDDGAEVHTYETDPLSVDTDGDDLDDGAEVEKWETDPLEADTDGDGLDDGAEVLVHETDPLSTDTDGDGVGDAAEVRQGGDPGDVEGGSQAFVSGSSLPFLVGVVLSVGTLAAVFALGYANRRSSEDEGADSSAGDDDGSFPGGPSVESGDSKLIRDEDKVMQILEENDGRVMQSTVVESTDWSKSKTSRVLSDMVDEERIRKISVGRENLVVLPDEVSVADAPHPNEDEE